jgi:acetoin utilization deacetylase AcuC-like enzyme
MITMGGDKIAFISHPASGGHMAPFPRPNIESFESPLRTQMAESYLRTRGILDDLLCFKSPRAKETAALLVHSPYLVDSVKLMSEIGIGQVGESAYVSPELFRTALFAVGGAMRSAELVAKGEALHAFSLMRPPGHHASTSTPSGLCFFNNVAIAVRHAMKHLGVGKVSILDFDDHFGNGTAEIFYSDPNVQYVSIHEYDYEEFGLGHYLEVGHGEAAGTKTNIPLVEGTPDSSYISAIDRVVLPAIERFGPEILAVSAGYDSHYADPVGNMDLTSKAYWHLGNAVMGLVERLGCSGSFWVLEGGYNPLVLGPCIEASLAGLAKSPLPKLDDQIERETNESVIETNESIIEQVLETLDAYS